MAEDEKPQRPAKPDKAGRRRRQAGQGAKARQGQAPTRPPRARPDKAAAQGPRTARVRPGQGRAPKAEKVARAPRPKDYKPRMKTHYEKVVREEMTKQFGYKNAMQIPRIEKIVLNMGVGEAVNDRKKVDSAAKDLAMIAGQRAGRSRARASRSPPTSCATAWRSAPR